tara:strand:+ start:615 stop:1532 length:918 start_codon:yes stop_codon:yes gene_type:complete
MSLNFSSINALVIGDLMIDNYIEGNSTRMSPEAPVPVIIPKKEFSIPGGAANVAMNLSSLGAKVSCAGAVGDDSWGSKLIKHLNAHNINTENIEIFENFNTTIKQRIFSNGKQVIRIDTEDYFKKTCHFMNEKFDFYDLIILSDYNKGILTNNWFQKPKDSIVLLDPKKSFINFNQCDIITPNLNELQVLSGIEINTTEDIILSCKNIIDKYSLKYIIAKRGEDGITIVHKNASYEHIKAKHVHNPDVTGAGDTVIASLGLAFSITKNISASVKFSVAAAALSVSKLGTATVTIDEINNYINENE